MAEVKQVESGTVIDLTDYILIDSEKSFCPGSGCSRAVHLLSPRDPSAQLPLYYLCQTCGRILQVGKGEIAPPCR